MGMFTATDLEETHTQRQGAFCSIQEEARKVVFGDCGECQDRLFIGPCLRPCFLSPDGALSPQTFLSPSYFISWQDVWARPYRWCLV